MRAGSLRHRIRIQARSTTADALGGQSGRWSDVATVWADVAPLAGRELLAAQAIHAEVSHLVEIRYQPAFANPLKMAAMRVLYGDRVFNIRASLDPGERHQSLELTCSEGLTDG